jgi:hypothetical protein
MRPVERGPAPIDADGSPKVFAEYGDAREDLIARIGDYCSYCEMAFPVPAVEHVKPKSVHSGLATAWDNLLLACPSCNSGKGATDPAPGECVWPDVDDTHLCFEYELDRAPRVAGRLEAAARKRAEATLSLMGLDREPGHPDLSARDRRWRKRLEAWGKAIIAKKGIDSKGIETMGDSVAATAHSTGFFSVWMAVFADNPQMRNLLVNWFRGTAKDCYGGQGQSIPRGRGTGR